MKKNLLMVGALALISTGVDAQVIYSENFESTTGTSLPTGWTQTGDGWRSGTRTTLNDADYFPLTGNTTRFVAVNDRRFPGDNNDATLKTSSFSLVGHALPVVKFKSSFFGYYYTADPSNPETFKLRYSTDGGTTWTTIGDIPGNTAIWEDKYISLSAAAGSANVMLGFQYSDRGTEFIAAAIDDVEVFNAPAADLELLSVTPVSGTPSAFGMVSTGVTLGGIVLNKSGNTVTSYVVKYQYASGSVVTHNITGVSIAPFTKDTFEHATPFNIPSVGDHPINIWVEIAGDADLSNNEKSVLIKGVSTWPAKQILFEEMTGTWCGYCPRGTYFMDEFAHDNPGKAAQVAVHNGDPMAISAYDSYIQTIAGSGWPNMAVDRTYSDDPSYIQDYYDELKNTFAYAELAMGTPSVSGTSVSIPVTIKPATNIDGAKGLLIITESNLKGEGSGWNQENYYSYEYGSSRAGDLPGWTDLPKKAPNTKFHFVARATNNPAGLASDAPASMTAGSTYNVTVNATLGSSWNVSNLQYTYALIGADGKVLNSISSVTPFLEPVLSTKNTVADVSIAELYPNPTSNKISLKLHSEASFTANVNIVNVNGQVLINKENHHFNAGESISTFDVSSLPTGVYMVNVQSEKGNITFKFVKK